MELVFDVLNPDLEEIRSKKEVLMITLPNLGQRSRSRGQGHTQSIDLLIIYVNLNFEQNRSKNEVFMEQLRNLGQRSRSLGQHHDH